MKIDTQVAEVQSTFVGEDVAMQISKEAEVHIMEMLAGLYQNRLGAVLREYGTNALDAHIDAGVSIPFDVTLPSALTPFLKIRDYGNGLDVQGIREIYSQYGASTARKTDDQVGGFGLGAKSGLAYNSKSFTVTSVKNGRRINVMVGLDENGCGRMKVLEPVDGEPTEDASGTTITVAIAREDIQRCEAEARRFYSYWAPGKVLVNGDVIPSFQETALRLNDNLYMVEASDSDLNTGMDTVVMGNVPYPVKLDVGVARTYPRWSVIAIVPIGSCVPVPSREALKDVRKTKETLAKIGDDFKFGMQGAIQREVDAAPTAAKALEVVTKWARYLPGASRSASNYAYKGKQMPDAYTPALLPGDPYNRVETSDFSLSGYYRGTSGKGERFHAAKWHGALWLTNFEPTKFNASHKDKIMYWAKTNGIGFRTVTLPDGSTRVDSDGTLDVIVICRDDGPQGDDRFFMNTNNVVDYATIKAIKLPKDPSKVGAGRHHISGSFRAYTETGFHPMLKGDDIRLDKPVFYINGNQHEGRTINTALKSFHTEYTFVCLQANRVDKFKRDVPKVKHAEIGLQEGFKTWIAGIPTMDRNAIAMFDAGCTGDYRSLDASRINDPALARAARIAQVDISKWHKARERFRYIMPSGTAMPGAFPHPLDTKYPLYSSAMLRSHPNEVYDYLNHIYATKG